MKVLVLSNDFNVPLWGDAPAASRLRAMAGGFALARAQVLVAARLMGPSPPSDAGRAFECIRIPDKPGLPDPEFSPRAMNARLLQWLIGLHRKFPFDVIYERHALWTTAGLDAARYLGIRHVLEADPRLFHEATTHGNPWLSGEVHAAERCLVRKGDRLLAFSDPLARDLEAMGAAKSAILREPLPIADAIFGAAREERAPGRPFTIGLMGSLTPGGVNTLLAASGQLDPSGRSVALHVVGDGPLKADIEAAASRFAGVTFVTPGDAASLAAAVDSFDVGVAPLEDDPRRLPDETIGACQARGIPVIASGGESVRAMMDHGRAGLLVPCGDVPALVRALHLLQQEPALGRSLAEAARQLTRDQAASRVGARLLRAVPLVPDFVPAPRAIADYAAPARGGGAAARSGAAMNAAGSAKEFRGTT